jgi:hypothetical protein
VGTSLADPLEILEIEPDGVDGLAFAPDEITLIHHPAGSGLALTGSFDGGEVAQVDGPFGLALIALGEPVAPLRPTVWSIYLCQGWTRIAEATAYQFHGSQRLNAAGDWGLETSLAGVEFGWRFVEENPDEPGPTTGEWVQYDPRDVDTIRVVENGEITYSGFVTEFKMVIDGSVERWTFNGVDLWQILEDRICFPDPTTEPPWPDSHDVVTAAASAAITTYLLNNVGADALEDRQLPGGGVEDLGISTDEVTWSARLQPLSTLVQRIANDGGVVVGISVSAEGDYSFTVGPAINRTEQIRLSDRGDLKRIEASFLPVSKTYTITGGTGEGVDRLFKVADTGATGDARKEQFSDLRSSSTLDEVGDPISAVDELQADADMRNVFGAAQYRIHVEVTDEAATALNYPHETGLGDLVTIDIKGVAYQVALTEATFELTPERRQVHPVFGTAIPNALVGLDRDVAGLGDRFDNSIA